LDRKLNKKLADFKEANQALAEAKTDNYNLDKEKRKILKENKHLDYERNKFSNEKNDAID
jgi:chromosome segregation ATPase